MDDSLGKGHLENWVVSEMDYEPDALGKYESILYLGNGYMGLRSATEEPYLTETRNLFVNGTFNQADKGEVAELPNLADVTRIDIRIDGERFSLEFGKTIEYVRELNLKTAELTRSFIWTSPKGKELRFQFKRFVSLDQLHLIAMKMDIKSLSDPVDIAFDTGINAQMTNSGVQHFMEGERSVHDGCFMELLQTTSHSNIHIVLHTAHKVFVNGGAVNEQPDMHMARRKVSLTYNVSLKPDDQLTLEKITTVYTSRDKVFDKLDGRMEKLRPYAFKELCASWESGYDALFKAHRQAWEEKVWRANHLQVDSENPFDQLAIRFALYHLTAMAPAHDERMGIGAKALSGEGYKGHSFWDTEIFILPFFIYANPEMAKSLLIYRYHGLESARKKAADHGYEGAMYPWEAAWPTDGEVTPTWGDVDIVTGKRTKIWPGLIEQHITADIAFAVYHYYVVTNDEAFMDNCGYEMIFDTATFWASRLEWCDAKGQYVINDVIGPDEYKEHVNNNAYTNYMAYFNLKLAVRYYEKLKDERPEKLAALDTKLDLEGAYPLWQSKSEKLYLPIPQADRVIPQDDTYRLLKRIDLSKYKHQDAVRSIYKDYSPKQISRLQVTKQADVLLLLYLLEQTFLNNDRRLSSEIKRANFEYYEPKTLHDSSLSLATHAILANDIGRTELAYTLFKQAAEIDLNPVGHASDEGVHAAAIGGIWSAAIFGFVGIRVVNEQLTINPKLPKHWRYMALTIHWRGQPLTLSISHTMLCVQPANKEKIVFEVFGTLYECDDEVKIPLSDVDEP